MTKIIVSDIESRNWIEFLCIGFYDGKLYKHFLSLQEYFDFIYSKKDVTSIYFHFGGGFDFLFLLKHAFENDKLFTVTKMIPRGSKFLTISIKYKNKTIKFLDSSCFLPFALRTLAENFNVETKKGTIDYDNITEVTDELLDYMKDDHLALYQVIKKYSENHIIKKVGLKMTIASQAYSVFKECYLTVKIIPLKKHQEKFARLAFQGGRTEIYKPLFLGDENTELHEYDVNSLYPSVMATNDFPIAFDYSTKTLDLEKLSINHVKVYIPENTYMPPLGIVEKETKKYIFPTGTFSGYWTNIELKTALKYGAKIIKVYECHVYKNGGNIFEKYISEIYMLRKNSPKISADNIIYKLLMNSLFGRYALNTDREKIVIDDGRTGIKPYLEIPMENGNFVRLATEKVELNSETFVPIAVFVTSYARVHCYENFLYPLQKEVFYSDTDSFYLLNKLPSSNELGEVKHEKSVNQACFILPKSYIAGNFVKLKGFDSKKAQNFTIDDFTSFLEGEMRIKQEVPKRIARFKESLRRNKKILSMLPKSEKVIRSIYDKREIIKLENDLYDSFPLVLNTN